MSGLKVQKSYLIVHEYWLIKKLLHIDPEGELRTDLAPIFLRVPSCPLAGRQFTEALPSIPRSREVRDPHVFAHSRSAVISSHLIENRSCLGVHSNMVKGRDLCMPLHIRLPGEDKHLQRLLRVLGERHGSESRPHDGQKQGIHRREARL